MNVPSYWKLSRDDRYRITDESYFPEKLGGRDTDITQLAYSVENLVCNHYPINSVPTDLARQVEIFRLRVTEAESVLSAILELVCADTLAEIEHKRNNT